jgi:hypothetical protein
VPADFDQTAYRNLFEAATQFHGRSAWPSYASGANAVAYRFAAADESHERFVVAITGADAFRLNGPRYTQEESLFTFFVNALSTLECLHFALYNLGACVKPGAFPAETRDDLRGVSIKETTRRFKMAYSGTPFTKTLLALRDSTELKALIGYRDFLTHRGVPPRRHDLGYVPPGGVVDMSSARSVTIPSEPKDIPSNWTYALSLSANMTIQPRTWLAEVTNKLLSEAATFFAGQAPATP